MVTPGQALSCRRLRKKVEYLQRRRCTGYGGDYRSDGKSNGWHFQADDGALDWDSVIGEQKDDLVLVDKSWIEGKELNIPDKWNPVEQITKYLETLFEAGETVGYVTESWEKDSKYLPTKGVYTRTAGELIEALSKCEGDIGRVIGDCKPEAGAWIRFNPLDGKGVKNENVTEFRYALVESDTTDITHQNQIIRELELPIACLVYSGGKSLHAIVRIDAANFDEYRKRVDYLYDVCKKNGIGYRPPEQKPVPFEPYAGRGAQRKEAVSARHKHRQELMERMERMD